MLIVSAGMVKSGSAYIYNLINDALIKGGFVDARAVKADLKLHNIDALA